MTKCSCKQRRTRRTKRGGAWMRNYWDKCNITKKINNGEVDIDTKETLQKTCCNGFRKYLTPQRPAQCRALQKHKPTLLYDFNEKMEPIQPFIDNQYSFSGNVEENPLETPNSRETNKNWFWSSKNSNNDEYVPQNRFVNTYNYLFGDQEGGRRRRTRRRHKQSKGRYFRS